MSSWSSGDDDALNVTTLELPTNDEFVADLFATHGQALFSADLGRPGRAGSFLFSRTNTALATYIINTQIVLAQREQGVPEDELSGLGTFLMDVIFPALSLVDTFVLDRTGRRSPSVYPPRQTTDWLPFISMQDVSADGRTEVVNRPIHPAYAADYMVYTTTNSLLSLMARVLLPEGPFYDTIGARLSEGAVAIGTLPAAQYLANSGAGLFNMSLTALCDLLGHSLDDSSSVNCATLCTFEAGVNVASDTAAYGLIASGEFSQVAIVCVPSLVTGTWCSATAVAYNQKPGNGLSERLSGDTPFTPWPLLVSVASVAEFTSQPLPPTTGEPTPAPTDPPGPPRMDTKNFGLYVFLGVLATVVVVVVASYVADYFIQPAPPAKIIVPVPSVPTAAAAAAGGAGGGDAFGVDHLEGLSPGQQQLPMIGAGPGLFDGDGFMDGGGGVTPEAFRSRTAAATGPLAGMGYNPRGQLSINEDDSDDDETTTTTATTTTTTGTTTTSSYTGTSTLSTSDGVSPEGMRRRGGTGRTPQQKQRHERPHDRSEGRRPRHHHGKDDEDTDDTLDSNSHSKTPGSMLTGGRLTSESQGPSGGGGDSTASREIPRFDAYI